jgi:tetratricopeptide (TPR) repeat protein
MPAMLSTGRRVRRFAIALTLMLAAPASLRDAGAQPAAQPAYVGSAACGSCHAREHAAWRSSQHAQAMAEASERTVLGDFADARFTHAGATSRFFRRDGRYVVRTDGPGGKPVDVEVRYTFGVYPLQQYLVALPGGRLQALGIAWDARPKANGGQRWFHLYPDRRLKAGDALHWTGLDQNWNYQCADCHSTDVRKNYDAATRSYKTTWSEISVGCEACHGPGERHVAWAKDGATARATDPTRGLVARLDERRGVAWPIDAASGTAVRSVPRTTSREIDTCARCHARRGQFDDRWHAGQPVGDAFRVALIEPGLYHADGQMLDEVYDHGSFLQSRMHAKGVTCSDCHDPHGGKLRAPGNAVCGQCHAPSRFDVEAHHRHRQGGAGAACVACHMPTTTYMIVDPRHDHSIRIPRPDRTVAIGTPNACDACHAKQGAAWAVAAIARWYPSRKPGFQSFAETFAAADRGAPRVAATLAGIAGDREQPSYVRASAIARLAGRPGADAANAVARGLGDADPLVRAAAARAMRARNPAAQARALAPLLADPVRDVRMEAARGLAGAPERALGPTERARFAAAFAEVDAALAFNADRPESHADRGVLAIARGDAVAAAAAFRTALELDRTFAPAAVNLADVYRALGREADAQAVLAQAIRADPAGAAPRHALGLSYVRQRRMKEALASLGDAARLDPANPRYAYVYAVALHDAGREADAIATLRAALERHPHDREVLGALAAYTRRRGDAAAAAAYERRLADLAP